MAEKIGDWNGLDVAHFPNAEYKGTRADFGVNIGVQYGFRQEVALRIQVEASRQD